MTRARLLTISGMVDERDHDRLVALARAHDRTISAEVRRAVRSYVRAHERVAVGTEQPTKE
jgi:hypothetical protein